MRIIANSCWLWQINVCLLVNHCGFLAGIQATGSKYSASSNFDAESSRPAYRLDFPDLEQQCYSFVLVAWLPRFGIPMRQPKRKFISFCWQLGNLHPSRSPCLMDGCTLCLIVMFLTRTLQQLLIKVNLSGFRALHMDQGCLHLLVEYPSRKGSFHSHWSWQASSLCSARYDDIPCF